MISACTLPPFVAFRSESQGRFREQEILCQVDVDTPIVQRKFPMAGVWPLDGMRSEVSLRRLKDDEPAPHPLCGRQCRLSSVSEPKAEAFWIGSRYGLPRGRCVDEVTEYKGKLTRSYG